MIRNIFTSLCVGTCFFASSAVALTAVQIVEREIVVQMDDGTQTVTRVKADTITPGDTVVYSLNYHNDKAEPAENITLTMPVPSEVKYLEGSADMYEGQTQYSVDGGATFHNREALVIQELTGGSHTAIAEDITHIRWTVPHSLAAGAKGTLSFKGVLQ